MTVHELLDICRDLQAHGRDFETIWREVLKPHPLVAGSVICPAYGNGQIRVVPLRGAGHLEFDASAATWAARGQL